MHQRSFLKKKMRQNKGNRPGYLVFTLLLKDKSFIKDFEIIFLKFTAQED
jgi:hypothetical protein